MLKDSLPMACVCKRAISLGSINSKRVGVKAIIVMRVIEIQGSPDGLNHVDNGSHLPVL